MHFSLTSENQENWTTYGDAFHRATHFTYVYLTPKEEYKNSWFSIQYVHFDFHIENRAQNI